MNVAESIRNAWHFRWVVVATILIPTLAAAVFAATRPQRFTTSVAFTVNRINNDVNTKEYQYDGYYALQASDLFSDTVVSWFLTPSIIVDMYNTAGVPVDTTNLTKLTSQFNIKKYSSQNLVVKFGAPSKADAGKLSTAIIATMETKASQLNLSADKKALFEVIGSTPVTVQDSSQLGLVSVVGFILGAFLATLLVGLLVTLRQARSSTSAGSLP